MFNHTFLRLVIVISVCSILIEAFRQLHYHSPLIRSSFNPSHLKQKQFERLFPLWLRPQIGETVVAEIEDITGGIKDPLVLFNIRKDGEVHRGKMSAKALTSQERMLLQSGSLVNVQISGEDKENRDFFVSLAAASGAGRGDREEQRDRRDNVNSYSNFNYNRNSYNNQPRQQNRNPEPSKKRSNEPVVRGGVSEPEGPLLNNLKTGMPLEVTVKTVTPFAAFVRTKVYRKAKGGVFVPVEALLHRSDIPQSMLAPTPQGYSILYQRGQPLTVYVKEVLKQAGKLSVTTDPHFKKDNLLEDKSKRREAGNIRRRTRRLRKQLENVLAGDTVTGVVEKVVPEGIIVTIDSLGPLNVSALVRQQDLPAHYQLPATMDVSAKLDIWKLDFARGRTVTAGVIKVSDAPHAGKLYSMVVSLEGMGPLPEEDLSLPTRNREEEEKEDDDDYDYEDDDEEDDDDEAEEVVGKALREEDEEEKNNADKSEGQYEDDVRDIFLELSEGRSALTSDDIFNWAEMNEMLEEGVVSEDDVHRMIATATGTKPKKATSVSFEQFKTLCDLIREKTEGETSEQADETSTPPPNNHVTSEADTSHNNHKKEEESDVMSSKQIKTTADTNKSNNNNNNNEEKEEEEEYEEEEESSSLEDEFEQLKNKQGKVTLHAVLQWEEIKGLIEEEFITKEQILSLASDVLKKPLTTDKEAKNTVVTVEQFADIIDGIDRLAGGADEEEQVAEEEEEGEEGSEGNDDVYDESWAEEERQAMFDRLRKGKKEARLADVRKEEEIADLFNENILDEDRWKQIVTSVLGKNVNLKTADVTYDQFKAILLACDDVVEEAYKQYENDLNTDADDDDDVEEVEAEEKETSTKKKQQVTSSQTPAKSNVIAPSATTSTQKEEEEEEYEEDGEDEDDDVTEEDMLEARREFFNELLLADVSRSKKNKKSADVEAIRVRDLKASDDIQELLEDGDVSEAQLDAILRQVTGKGGAGKVEDAALTFEQFSDVLEKIDELIAENGDDDDNDDSDDVEAATTSNTSSKKSKNEVKEEEEEDDVSDEDDDEDDEEEPSEEEIAAARQELFEELRTRHQQRLSQSTKNKNKKNAPVTSVKTVLASDVRESEDFKELFDEGVLDDVAWSGILAQATGRPVKGVNEEVQLSYDEFCRLVEVIDERLEAEAADDDDEEDDDVSDEEADETEKEEGEEDDVAVARGELFDRLIDKNPRNKKAGDDVTVLVKHLKQSDDIQQLFQDKLLSDVTWDNLIAKVVGKGGAKTSELSYEQFDELLDLLDDVIAEAEENTEPSDVTPDNTSSLPPSSASPSSISNKREEAEVVEEGEEGGSATYTLEEVAELFDVVAKGKKSIEEADLYRWSDLSDLMREGIVTKTDVSRALYAVKADPRHITVESFGAFANKLMNFVYGLDDTGLPPLPQTTTSTTSNNNKGDVEEVSLEDMKNAVEEMVEETSDYSEEDIERLFYAIASTSTPTTSTSTNKKNKKQKESLVITEEASDESSMTITLTQLLAHDEFKEVVTMGLYTPQQLRQRLVEAGMDPKSEVITFPQFQHFVLSLQQAEEEEEEEQQGGEGGNDVAAAGPTKEDIKEIYDELRGKATLLPVENVRLWDDMVEMMEDKVLTKTDLDLLLTRVTSQSKPRQLSFEQFLNLTELLGQLIATHHNNVSKDDADVTPDNAKEMQEELSNVNSPAFKIAARKQFDGLKGKTRSDVISFEQFKGLEEVRQMLEDEVMSASTLTMLWKEVQNKRQPNSMTFDQFLDMKKLVANALALAQRHQRSPASSTEEVQTSEEDSDDVSSQGDEEVEEGEGDVEEKTQYIFDQLKSAKSDKILIRKLMRSPILADILTQTALTKADVSAVLKKMKLSEDSDDVMKFPQFQTFINLLNDVVQAKASTSTATTSSSTSSSSPLPAQSKFGDRVIAEEKKKKGDKNARREEEDEEDDEEEENKEVSDEELLEDLRKSIFQELTGKRGHANLMDLLQMEGADELFGLSATLNKHTIDKVTKELGIKDPTKLSYREFSTVLDELSRRHQLKQEKEEVQQKSKSTTSAPPSPAALQRRAELAKVIGAAVKNPALPPIDPMPEIIPASAKNEEVELLYENESGAMAKPASLEDDLRTTFDGLRRGSVGKGKAGADVAGSSSGLRLVDFLRWTELQEMLQLGALTKESLAQAIEEGGVTNAKADQAILSFDQFKVIIDRIDDVIDHSKLPSGPRDDEEEDDDDDSDVIEKPKPADVISSKQQLQRQTKKVEEAVEQGSADDEEEEEEEEEEGDDDDEDYDDAQEEAAWEEDLKQMFKELSKGKSHVTRSQLAKWGELQELVAGGLCTEDEVNQYIADLPSDSVSFTDFASFVNRLQDVNLDNVNPDVINNLLQDDDDEDDVTPPPKTKKNNKKDNNNNNNSVSGSSNQRKKK